MSEVDATTLDAMTKDELLALAQSLGVSPANASMTKDDLRAGIEAHEAGSATEAEGPGLRVTTTKTKDYLGRLLTNATPGTSQATDHLGRSVVAGDKDYAGRALV